MPASSDKPDQVLASERFAPRLSACFESRYCELIRKLGESLPINRVEIIRNEIIEASNGDNLDQLELWKYSLRTMEEGDDEDALHEAKNFTEINAVPELACFNIYMTKEDIAPLV